MNGLDSQRMANILIILKNHLKIKILDISDPFESLILTILSQNTNDINRDRAWKRLVEKFKSITPDTLASADISDIQEAIKVAGLHNQKSKRIKEISTLILNEYNGNMDLILKIPLKQARKILVNIKGVGYKTADILLLFYSNYLTLPLDTHIQRVSKRMGFASADDKYEDIRIKLQAVIANTLDDFIESHLFIIELGRKYCKAIKPQCDQCPVSEFCPKIILKKPKKKKSKKIR
ncbi:MAG: endonuclease III [Candidatus Lokiarchaeota archaeon]|nr:endonuclease III [Candidatus Lokiarchaeota archaeon]